MAQAQNQELTERFIQFYRNYYRDAIGQLAQNYPNEQRSLYVDYEDLYRFDTDLADDYLNQPDQLREYAEEALRLYDLPADVKLGKAHVRLRNIDRNVDIRSIRVHDDHIGKLISVSGIVRKATDVRPKITEAAFECQRCGTMTYIPQSDGNFQEPHECQGCERQGPFRVNFDQSEFIDSQKIRVQESPEGLRGGETPQSIDVNMEDDVTGKVTAGDHVTVTGVLHIEQQQSGQEKSAIFDLYMDGVAIDIEDEEFEDMEITKEDKQQIVELSERDTIYEDMVASVAPAIYGYEEEKLAMILQLFSGVTKNLPDGSRIRGDLHMLLIGDPGTGKCVDGDTLVTLADGSEVPIRKLVEENLDDPKPVDDGVWDDVDVAVPSLTADGSLVKRRATKVWKRETPESMYRIETASGTEITVTPSHPLFVQSEGRFAAVRADELTDGQFVAVPQRVSTESHDAIDVRFRQSKSHNAVRLDLPDEWTASLARLVGYIIGEGYVEQRPDNTGYVSVTNDDCEILGDVAEALSELGLNYTERASRKGKSAKEIYSGSGEFVDFLANLEPAMLDASADQRVPSAIFRTGPRIRAEFVRAYVDSEVHVSTTERELTISSMSPELLRGVRSLLLSLGIRSQFMSKEPDGYRLRISGENFVRYVERVGFITDRKTTAAGEFEDVAQNTNVEVVPDVGTELRRLRESLGLTQFDCNVPRTTYQHYERGDRNPSRKNFRRVLSAFEDRIEELQRLKSRIEEGSWSAVVDAREALGISQHDPAEGMDVTQTAVSYYEREEVVPDGGKVDDASDVILDRLGEGIAARKDVEALRSLATDDIAWDRIESIELVEPTEEWVYDLEVEGTHNYLTNGVISHNSQMISYIQNIAPRSVYTSGKGSSSAGLTAAAVRDDFGDGQQWTLEAGALVLADKGIAAVDELDKMRSEDRSAMHEALEQQKISISKAGINATLKSRCSLLGAANPKYGRFDQYEPIGEQIDLEPALISRFDLIFTVTDQPDPEHDAKLADHILKTNYAGELNTQRTRVPTSNFTEEEVDSVTEEVAPEIDAELLRKYIAFSKRNCFPTMTEEAKQAIRDFYVDLRSKGADEDAPVPVTARKLEALVRLAEASARVRLSDEVTAEDANRVIEIVRSCLQDIGVDPETGQFDADVVETGTSKSQRDRIKTLKQLISEIEEEFEEGAPIDEVLDRADEIGMGRDKADGEIEKLRRKGEVYEPKTDHLRTT
ncbi:intein C-terminal splicing region/intein N-terminal splicing region [Halogranum amylolyticum]|uniref:DNA helicase n=1 Tax=Halogranum amylolyticum TaxID=660520 RepID=A0A1H8QPW6_9EURY|nr:LAGLIDADG family homing endonuclease [Halogranum amylolyticum]SEO56017.1 intein C-terminal splicing region/intein N-terminal splicing region [Halogranum amylolyticum]